MDRPKEIVLFQRIAWFDKPVDKLYLRPPTGFSFMKYAEPRFIVQMRDGSAYHLEKDDSINGYLGDLLSLNGTDPVDGGANALFRLLSLADCIQVREALFDFFGDAREMISGQSRARSSSTSNASQQPTATA